MQGAEVSFRLKAGEGASVSSDAELEVYTTRPDTLFGVTYMVVAPEHPLLSQLTTPAQQAQVDAYVRAAGSMSDLERTELQKGKTGIFTGQSCRQLAGLITYMLPPAWIGTDGSKGLYSS